MITSTLEKQNITHLLSTDGFYVTVVKTEDGEHVQLKDLPDSGFQHLVAIKEHNRKNIQTIESTLAKLKKGNNVNTDLEIELQSKQSEPLLQQRKSKYRIIKDKLIGEQVIKVLDTLHRNRKGPPRVTIGETSFQDVNSEQEYEVPISDNLNNLYLSRQHNYQAEMIKMRIHSNLDFNSPKKQNGKAKESHRYTTPSARSSNVTTNMISPNFIPIEERVFNERRQSDNNGKIRANFKSVALRSPKLNNLTFHSPREKPREVMVQMQPQLSPQ